MKKIDFLDWSLDAWFLALCLMLCVTCMAFSCSLNAQEKDTVVLRDSAATEGDSVDTFNATVQNVVNETRRIVKRRAQAASRFLNERYIIVIDPGHGGTKYIDKGNSAKLDGIEYHEKDMMFEYAQLVEKKLAAAGYEGLRKTKEAADDSSLSIYTRAGRAAQFGKNAGKKVLFVSLHWNNFEDPSVGGTEIYIKESQNYKSRKLAEFLRGSMSHILQMHGAGQNITGIVERDYRVLREMDTGVLIEIGYASNPGDLRKMLSQKDEIATAMVNGIDAFAEYMQEQEAQKQLPNDDPKKAAEDAKLAEIPSIPFGWSWRKKDISADVDHLMKRYDGMYEKVTTEKEIYLTFDCGWENGYTPKILDVLKANEVKAAFFITGGYLKSAEDVVARMVQEGHIVGNHSVNHLSMPQLKVREMKREILGLEQDFYDLFEMKMNYFRPPSGEWSRRSLAVTQALGYKTVFWSFAYDDWDVQAQHGRDYAYKKITQNVRPGVIILLHAVSKDNYEALDAVIKDLRKDGYVFKSLNEIK